MDHSIICEVCIDTVAGARAADAGGADRIELCGELWQGGITPSRGLLEAVQEATRLPIMVMIRPRGGDFVYDSDEVDVMCRELDWLKKSPPVAGVVFGALTPQGEVDQGVCRRLLDAAQPMPATFHRAFDQCLDPHKAFDTLCELRFDRLLTSGRQQAAVQALDTLRDLVARGGNQLTVMPGGGVRPDNVTIILQETGAREIHFSARGTADDQRVFAGFELQTKPEWPAIRQVTSAELVRKTCAAARSLQ
jgi:copper homeostasis protein